MASEYVEYLLDSLGDAGTLNSRRMFGGHGLFCNGLMFALIADDIVYLKGDEQSAPNYQQAGCERFSYTRPNKLCYLNYYRAPDITLDDPFELQEWAAIAIASAQRADAKKRQK